MSDESDSRFADDEIPEPESLDEAHLAESEVEAPAVAPEVELLNDVTQRYLNEIGAKPLFAGRRGRLGTACAGG